MNIIVIDDQEDIRYSVGKILNEYGHNIYEFNGLEDDLTKKIIKLKPALILLDVKLGQISGIDILRNLKEVNINAPIILMTAYTTPTNIIEATKMGVRDILQKPFDAQHLTSIVSKYITSTINKHSDILIDNDGEAFIGSFESMGEIYKKIGLVASNDLSVMIRGETGCGKELVAKLIHSHSSRKDKPLITINCAAIPNELFESEFFGHEKGSFTGADRQHIGYLESGNGGTIFLDEIGEMPLFMQAKLLRFLETKKIKRVGGSKEIELNLKIVSATNVDIKESISKESFREDLYYRLSSLYVEMPPLRDRKDDIPLLVSHFIEKANKELSTNIKSINQDAMKLLIKHHWKGNVRELKNVITNAALHAIGGSITAKDVRLVDISPKTKELSLDKFLEGMLKNMGVEHAYKLLEDVENSVIKATLDMCDGNITKTSEYLKMSRNTLKSKLH